jgi:hypothetical protein
MEINLCVTGISTGSDFHYKHKTVGNNETRNYSFNLVYPDKYSQRLIIVRFWRICRK